MFTGLVQARGVVSRVAIDASGRAFELVWQGLVEPLSIGESVAVNGCCLTVTKAVGEAFTVQAGPETLLRTNLGRLGNGSSVNLERALLPTERLGGHFVQGHIDTTAELKSLRQEGEWVFFAFEIAREWTPLLVPKGSIALDGVSLTLVDVGENSFSIMLIPHTLAVTSLGLLREGSLVNVEVDILAKHVRKLLESTLPKAFGSSE